MFGCTLQRSSTYWLAVIPHIVLSTVHTASAGCFSAEANFDLVVSKNSNQESKMPNLVEALVGVEEDIEIDLVILSKVEFFDHYLESKLSEFLEDPTIALGEKTCRASG